MNKFLLSTPFFLAYNDNDALVPELWANESILILEENMVMGNLVHRDFSDEIAQFGDTVNTRKPNEFKAKRKTDDDDVTIQTASATNIPVVLNQHIHTSFMIKDGEESKSFKDLVAFYLQPAMLAQARFLDQVLLGQAIQFRNNFAGALGTADTSDNLVDLNTAQNILKVPPENRNLILTPRTQGAFLKIDKFVQYLDAGEMPPALKTAVLGQRFGYNLYMAQNASSVPVGYPKRSFQINLSAGYGKGTTTMIVNTGTGVIQDGSWITIAGDMTPYVVTDHSETTGATTSITIANGLRNAVANSAVVSVYTPGQVNLVAGYAAGYAKDITIDGFSATAIVPGTPVAFSANPTEVYTAIDTTVTAGATVSILLDRPLKYALSNDDYVGVGPAGEYNFAFQRNALALVSRPLAAPKTGVGALSAVANYNGFGMRAVITYDGKAQGHLVTLDVLAGVAVLDALRGAILYGG